MTVRMTEQEYRSYREEKWNYFFEVMSKHFDYDEDQKRLLRLGFMKGLDTATKGGKFVNQ